MPHLPKLTHYFLPLPDTLQFSDSISGRWTWSRTAAWRYYQNGSNFEQNDPLQYVTCSFPWHTTRHLSLKPWYYEIMSCVITATSLSGSKTLVNDILYVFRDTIPPLSRSDFMILLLKEVFAWMPLRHWMPHWMPSVWQVLYFNLKLPLSSPELRPHSSASWDDSSFSNSLKYANTLSETFKRRNEKSVVSKRELSIQVWESLMQVKRGSSRLR